ncbi:MAG: HlyD family efflux transporter periplasmic adaptor subunit [Lautropia sp.]|nr:MAG: HlyD family efflux transporter periplasmic adaptor subunit [Pseudomonadota bacterium]MBC6959775.1 HlyD family efflux transporter periplasmic adaptor subunit [Lautropia sp.]MCL4702081.1 efflux RND transporter periplasmic adaptor subunit [Burkholderiaceae bacterium]MDL1908182.1 HlyD family efflux transporter periplasmic adaptor subunit [Betaproteobacteria bacterium PRO1]RIK89171.1 MAG: EmrA/EmrK family multidrug efflux transporter periplasmic adaptor subunit [Burkholderiales bacterium]
MSDETASTAPASPRKRGRRRRIGLALVALVVLLAGAGYGAWWTLVGQHYVDTDNAYVQGHLVQITPQIAGTVLAINVEDTDRVEAGQPLALLDPADARVALAQAQAQLAQAVREAASLDAANATLRAGIEQREADEARARIELERAREDLQRRQHLGASGAVSGEELGHARRAIDEAAAAASAARAAVVVARRQFEANQALTGSTPVREHPNVLRAAAAVREAWLALERTTLPAPVSGYVARRSVQVGQRVQAGTPLMAVIPLDQVWVEANFKEVQLRGVRIGQPVKLTADLYGGKVEFDGRVTGLAAGTGAAFALLPPQNATGNWIKVVQRVPVRIALDAAQLREHPLRVGLSMQVKIDLHDQSGPLLAEAPRTQPPALAQADAGPAPAGGAASAAHAADAMIREIIEANLGRRAASGR